MKLHSPCAPDRHKASLEWSGFREQLMRSSLFQLLSLKLGTETLRVPTACLSWNSVMCRCEVCTLPEAFYPAHLHIHRHSSAPKGWSKHMMDFQILKTRHHHFPSIYSFSLQRYLLHCSYHLYKPLWKFPFRSVSLRCGQKPCECGCWRRPVGTLAWESVALCMHSPYSLAVLWSQTPSREKCSVPIQDIKAAQTALTQEGPEPLRGGCEIQQGAVCEIRF